MRDASDLQEQDSVHKGAQHQGERRPSIVGWLEGIP